MSFPSNYTCPEVRIPFNIPHHGRSWAFTSLGVSVDQEKQEIRFKKLFSYTSCPQESVIFREKVQITPRDAFKECSEDKKCKEFVDFYTLKNGFTIRDID